MLMLSKKGMIRLSKLGYAWQIEIGTPWPKHFKMQPKDVGPII